MFLLEASGEETDVSATAFNSSLALGKSNVPFSTASHGEASSDESLTKSSQDLIDNY